MNKFNPREVIEIAIEMEHQGQAFYQELIKAAKDNDEVSSVLRYMAAEEAGHAEDFKKLLRSLTEKMEGYDYPLDELSLLYFKAFAETQVFKDIDEAKKTASGFDNFADAVHYAIGLEVKTIAYYRELRVAMGHVPGVEIIDELIRQEQGHVEKLYRLLC